MSGRTRTRRTAAALSETACLLALITTLVIGLGAGRWMSTAQRLLSNTATTHALNDGATPLPGTSQDATGDVQYRVKIPQMRS